MVDITSDTLTTRLGQFESIALFRENVSELHYHPFLSCTTIQVTYGHAGYVYELHYYPFLSCATIQVTYGCAGYGYYFCYSVERNNLFIFRYRNVSAPCTTIQVTYGHAGYGCGIGEHHVCREEYQTKFCPVTLITVPLEVTYALAYTAYWKVCVTKAIELMMDRCRGKLDKVCFNFAKIADVTNTVE